MVFTAIEYGALDVAEQRDGKGRLKTLIVQQSQFSNGAGGLQYYIPQVITSGDVAQVYSRLRSEGVKLFRIKSCTVNASVLSGALRFEPWLPVMGVNWLGPSGTLASISESIDLLEGIDVPILSVRPDNPTILVRVITTATADLDAWVTTLVLEVVE